MRLPFLELSGTCLKQGQVHGESLKDLIEKNIAVYSRRFQKEAKLSKDEVLERTGSCLRTLKKQSNDYYEGIMGIAEGSNQELMNIAMLNFRYELLYHAIGKLQMDAVDGCTSYAVLPEVASNGHTIMGQNWDWIPDVECAIVETTAQVGPHQMAFTEAGIFGGKIGMNSEGLALTVNGMNTTVDDWSRFEKPFHLRCFEVLSFATLENAMEVLTGTPRSCTANFMIGQAENTVIDIELAPDTYVKISPQGGVLGHANHFTDPDPAEIIEPPNPRRYLSKFRHERMETLLNERKPLDVAGIQKILKDHHHSQSICRHPDPSLPSEQHTVTKTGVIMDLDERKLWFTNGNPCQNEFTEYSLLN